MPTREKSILMDSVVQCLPDSRVPDSSIGFRFQLPDTHPRFCPGFAREVSISPASFGCYINFALSRAGFNPFFSLATFCAHQKKTLMRIYSNVSGFELITRPRFAFRGNQMNIYCYQVRVVGYIITFESYHT